MIPGMSAAAQAYCLSRWQIQVWSSYAICKPTVVLLHKSDHCPSTLDLFVSPIALIQHFAYQLHSPGCECSREWRFCDRRDGNKCVHSSQHCSDRARYGFSADSNVWTLASKNVLRTCLLVLSMKHHECCC